MLLRLGFSASGAQQIALGAMITDPKDRSLVAEILTTNPPLLEYLFIGT